MRRIFVFVLFQCVLSYSFLLHGQGLAGMQEKYPEEMAVMLKLNQNVLIDIESDSIKIISEKHNEMFYLNEKARVFAQDRVYTSHFLKSLELKAKTLIPAGRKFKEQEVTNFEEVNDRTEGIFFDDSKALSFVYPGVVPGAKTVLDHKQRITDPHFLNSFYFGSYVPIEQASITLTVHKDINLKYRLFNEEDYNISFVEQQKGKYKIYKWSIKDVESLDRESDAPKFSYYAPHLIYHIADAEIKGKKQGILSNVDDLYKLYTGFVSNVDKKEDPELKEIVNELTAEVESEEEKVRKIFYWVQDNIKYIAFEDGMRGFIPHDASLVYEKRYGDCKDMANITHNMLSMAGIKSYLTWIGSRDLPYKYTEVPTPVVDNHMITTYEKDGQYYFLDATSKYTKFGLPSSMIQGKQALIAKDIGLYEIATVPVLNKEISRISDHSRVKIDGDKLVGTGQLNMDGYAKIFNAYRLVGLKDQKQSNFVRKMTKKGNNKYFLEDYEVENLEDRDTQLKVMYDYRVEDYVKTLAGEIYINMNLDKSFFNSKIDEEKRKLPIEREYAHTINQSVTLHVPEGYMVDYLPESASYSHPLFGFEISYKRNEDKIELEKRIYINHLILDKDKFEDWNTAIDELSEAYREVVILVKE